MSPYRRAHLVHRGGRPIRHVFLPTGPSSLTKVDHSGPKSGSLCRGWASTKSCPLEVCLFVHSSRVDKHSSKEQE